MLLFTFVLVGAAIAMNLPELRRYMRIRSM
jgi:hypothetical protein